MTVVTCPKCGSRAYLMHGRLLVDPSGRLHPHQREPKLRKPNQEEVRTWHADA